MCSAREPESMYDKKTLCCAMNLGLFVVIINHNTLLGTSMCKMYLGMKIIFLQMQAIRLRTIQILVNITANPTLALFLVKGVLDGTLFF